MISILVYGRNDSHGYNMHKRVALSLNCMAAVLSDPADEILFVDYNTPDDFPTLPEEIRDTLTVEARARLRILRVRPAVHARFQPLTHLLMAEPVARNVAVRRSNPANRWVLSTNTDMIFAPRTEKSLTELVRDLPGGYYGMPRFELPESLWESLDRGNPQEVIANVEEWGRKFHLNEIIHALDPIKFDNPGDFQLMAREDLHRIHGFDEAMLRGWHVDSNLFKRLSLLRGGVGDLGGGIHGYHCGHTRQVTPQHRQRTAENNFEEFVHRVTVPELSRQAETWGLAHDAIEEIRLDGSVTAFSAMLETIAVPLPKKTMEQNYSPAGFDKVDYEPAHLLAFLADLFANTRRDISLAWVGMHAPTFAMLLEIRRQMGFTAQVLVCASDAKALSAKEGDGVELADMDVICARAGEFIFDFVRGDGGAIGTDGEDATLALRFSRDFRKVVCAERTRIAANPLLPRRRVMGINAIHNRFEKMMAMDVDAAKAPLNTRLRYGLVIPAPAIPRDWLALAHVGPAGLRTPGGIETCAGVEGPVMSGPHLGLHEGRYRASFMIEAEEHGLLTGWKMGKKKRVALLDVICGTKLFGHCEILEGGLKRGTYCVDFEIMAEDVDCFRAGEMETRAWTSGAQAFAVTAIRVELVDVNAVAKTEDAKS